MNLHPTQTSFILFKKILFKHIYLNANLNMFNTIEKIINSDRIYYEIKFCKLVRLISFIEYYMINLNNKKNIFSLICKYSIRSFLLTIFSVNKTLANNCQNIGELGTSEVNGKLVISRENLIDAISDGSYSIDGPDQNGNTISYTLQREVLVISTRNITDFRSYLKQKNI